MVSGGVWVVSGSVWMVSKGIWQMPGGYLIENSCVRVIKFS